MQLIHSVSELRQLISQQRGSGARIGFVPTMGALHQGHLSLVQLAQQRCDFVVVSVFVNPLQFGANEDFDTYPRTLGIDANLLSDHDVDVLFAPSPAEVYPAAAPVKQLSAGAMGEKFEGEVRPGHFDGMLTVVNRLFDIVEPDYVFFGQKDAQQVALVKQMLSQQISSGRRSPIALVVGKTIRNESGLALSSRNKFLTDRDMPAALSLSRALFAGEKGNSREEVLALARAEISPEAKLEYLELVDADSFEPTEPGLTRAALIVAAKVGEVRLIDNVYIDRKS
ncbi:MAG: pantoate--beta-alanine ligase [Aquiluna sp.]|nr:pantoate--beta-alanine ligase [Aquiluna sp.]